MTRLVLFLLAAYGYLYLAAMFGLGDIPVTL